ncbi:electron transport complex subunit RsxC [Sideroxydans lithotrophicus]|uniref:Ion-translocating oxidoreductase complex subunit C n=1 Tax=Sideroxydans lithotrophicus (strain ES-1) TaxID=580332 RepID=D5CMN8_SIDLE|nr:electron transport complex subunit RsxC [Sideroxydans lithotrophicus]ADE12710.1 electron transport complex, RnfABCDGE type, C subunit [Sideroxydans lithotrophicus ES-1]
MRLPFFKRAATFEHGIHPAYHKETGSLPIRRMAFAPRLIVPLSQHIGKPAVCCVNVGQEVVRGEVIATADGFVSLPVHAPATGVVEDIGVSLAANGKMVESITIRVYEADSQEVQVRTPRDVESLGKKELLEAIQQTGISGLGGATFPAHVKLNVPPETAIDTLVVNGAECEPFLTCDHRIMVERTQDLLRGIRFAMQASGAPRAVIGVEDNKPDAIAAIEAALPLDGTVTVKALETKYPQGAEDTIIYALLGREIPAGQRPASIGVLVNNVMTLAYLGRLLPAGEGIVERVLTVAGPAVEKPGNYIVPIGTPLRFLLEQVGAKSNASEIILGGPMMGMTISSLDVPVTKGTSGVLAFGRAQLPEEAPKVYSCIKCGECLKVCPKFLNPSQLGLLAAKREYEEMAERYNLDRCFECGCCSYVCPSHIPLVQQFRIAKAVNREKASAA